MADTPLPAPTNALVNLLNIIIDGLIKGLGKDIVIAEAIAYQPWLGWPVIHDMFSAVVGQIADYVDVLVKRNVDTIVIRFQNDNRKTEYDSEIAIINSGTATAQDIANAEAAIIRLVNRTH
jgi:hypothetical protein